MALTQSVEARNAALDAKLALLNGGVMRVYSGSKPATTATSATGTLLAEFDLASPAFDAASSGSAALADAPATVGLDAGTAGYFRLCDPTEAAGTGLGVIDGTCGTSGADAILSTTTVSVGLDLTVQSCTFTEPSGA